MNKQIERNKRSAAGTAKATKGRSRVFRDKSKYNRKVASRPESER